VIARLPRPTRHPGGELSGELSDWSPSCRHLHSIVDVRNLN
jgi:hypothetical protein